MLTALAVVDDRNLRDVVLPQSRRTLDTGAKGSGKSKLYRAAMLAADASRHPENAGFA